MIADVILEGDKVRLRPLTREDLPHFVRWLSDPEVTQYLASPIRFRPPSLGDEEEWFSESAGRLDLQVWAIEAEHKTLIGDVGLTKLDLSDNSVEIGILIGDKTAWDRGYGTDTIRTLLRHAFQNLHIHRVQLRVAEENRRGIRCYEKCGFVLEGILRQDRQLADDRYGNSLIMSVLRPEFAQQRQS